MEMSFGEEQKLGIQFSGFLEFGFGKLMENSWQLAFGITSLFIAED